MWLTFVIAAGLIAYFGTTMAATLRSRASALAAAREEILRNEQIIGVATLAAGTAHELSTPLGSIALIAGELKADAPEHRREIDLMLSQIDACKNILRRLRTAANTRAAPVDSVNRVDRFVADVRERFELLRPAVAVDFSVAGDASNRFIAAEETLRQAVLNLLDNAADVSPHAVECSAHCARDHLVLDIRDRGAGFNSSAAATPSNCRLTHLPTVRPRGWEWDCCSPTRRSNGSVVPCASPIATAAAPGCGSRCRCVRVRREHRSTGRIVRG